MSSSLKVSQRTEFTSWIWQSEFTWVRVSRASWKHYGPAALSFSATPGCLQRWGCSLYTAFFFPAHADGSNVIATVAGCCCISCSRGLDHSDFCKLFVKQEHQSQALKETIVAAWSSAVTLCFFPSSFQNSEPHCWFHTGSLSVA